MLVRMLRQLIYRPNCWKVQNGKRRMMKCQRWSEEMSIYVEMIDCDDYDVKRKLWKDGIESGDTELLARYFSGGPLFLKRF